MSFGVVGVGVMGSNIARCLSSRGYKVNLYSRDFEKTQRIALEIGGRAYDNVKKLIEDSDATILFVTDDKAVLDTALSIASRGSTRRSLVLNASTITPSTSTTAMNILRRAGVAYIEAPVYGSADEARECRLVSIVAGEKTLFEENKRFIESYSQRIFYVGEIPRAMVLKLALNHVGLALPALLAEALALLVAWGVDIDLFREIAEILWFGQLIDRYWGRIFEDKPPRFKLWMAGKDYACISRALKEKKIPSIVAEALSTIYMIPSTTEYRDKDYPQIARYFIELAKSVREQE
mgnify:CR=1 FL=1